MVDNCLGFGTFPLKDILTDILPEAQECGYSIIDTSDDYFNEKYVAEAKCDMKIFTKFSLVNNVLDFDNYFKNIQKIFLENGKKINCYMLHWPYPHIYKKIWRKFEELYFNGEVDEIGVCNFTVQALTELIKDCRVKPMYNEIELHPLFQQKDVTDFCEKNGIRIISYSPFARMDKELIQNEKLINIAKIHNTDVTNIILKWNMQKGFIPIPSTSKHEHIKNMSAEMLEAIVLTPDDIAEIDSLECGKRIRFDPDTYFSAKTKLKLFLYSLMMR